MSLSLLHTPRNREKVVFSCKPVLVLVENRDALLSYCRKKGIEAKIHYPVPIYLQPALQSLMYKQGDFPVTDAHAKKIITFPCDQHLERSQLDYIIETVTDYYA